MQKNSINAEKFNEFKKFHLEYFVIALVINLLYKQSMSIKMQLSSFDKIFMKFLLCYSVSNTALFNFA
jgi:hypothetical protein